MGGGKFAPPAENRPFSVEKMKIFKNGWTEKKWSKCSYVGNLSRILVFFGQFSTTCCCMLGTVAEKDKTPSFKKSISFNSKVYRSV